MKLALSQFIAERLNLMLRFTNFSMTNLILFFGVLFVLPIIDLLSILIGGYVDIGELLVFSDSFLAEFIGASLLSLLLLNPRYSAVMAFNRLLLQIFQSSRFN